MKITIMRDQLIASLCTAAKGDIRTVLNGVFVEATSNETRLSSTDGTVMSTQRADAKDENKVDDVLRLIVPREVAERVKKDKHLPVVWIDDDAGEWGLTDYDCRTTFKPIDGQFPDYRRAIPRTPGGEAGQFDPNKIALLAKAAVALGMKDSKTGRPNVLLRHNGVDTALVSIGRDDWAGAISPLRKLAGLIPPETPPVWALAELTAPADIESLV